MPLISLDQFVEKTLVAKKPVKIYRSPGGEIVTTVKPGLSVGRVYSWVGGLDKTPLHFMFYAPAPYDKIPYYAKYEPGVFDYDLLREQGIKTVAEQTKEKEEANKPTNEKIFDYVKKYALWAGMAYAAFLVFKETRKK